VSELTIIYLTYSEAGEMLRCGKRTVGRKVKAGELEARGEGKGKRVLYDSVLRHPDYRRDGGLN
jgi:excisionase family DNA binding protein